MHYYAPHVQQALAAGGRLLAVRAEAMTPEVLAKAFDDFGAEFKGWKDAQATLIKGLEESLKGSEEDQKKAAESLEAQAKLIEKIEANLKEIETQVHDGLGQVETVAPKTMGDFVIQSEAFKALALKPGQTPPMDFKLRVEANTLVGQNPSGGESDNTLVDEQRRPGIIPGAFRALRVVDLLTTIPISSNAWEFTRENSWTNNAAETAEAAAKPESDLTFELLTVSIRTIAHWIKASNQILADAPALRAYIDRRLRHGVNNREDRQLIQGDGTGQNISGMTAAGNHTPFTPASGSDPIDNLNVAKYQIIGADYMPNGIIMNPADWGAIERQKDGQGQYLVGNPFGSITPIMWGQPVVATNNMVAGSFIMAAFDIAYDHLQRQSTVVEIGYVNTDFTQNLVTIRGEKRSALASNIPAATRYGALQ